MFKHVAVFATLIVNSTVIHIAQLTALLLWPALPRPVFAQLITHSQGAFVELIHLITAVFAPGSSIVASFPHEEWADRLLAGQSTGERAIVMSNHQTWTDWTYLWLWSYYLKYDSRVKIILKASPKWVPVFGPGMQFFRFVFLHRNWLKDQRTLETGLEVIGASPSYWLLMFPEGTIITSNTRGISHRYALKAGLTDLPEHTLVPRSTGLWTCIEVLKRQKQPVTHLYDLTLGFTPYPPLNKQSVAAAVEAVVPAAPATAAVSGLSGGGPQGSADEDAATYPSALYKLRGVYCEGKNPQHIHVHCERIALQDVPDNREQFDKWLMDRFRAKSALLKRFYQTGQFAPAKSSTGRETRTVEWHIRPVLPWKLLACWAVVSTWIGGIVTYSKLTAK
ncbi:hypothetical protein RI367_001350 [Sorochytrium milnesiophthora]